MVDLAEVLATGLDMVVVVVVRVWEWAEAEAEAQVQAPVDARSMFPMCVAILPRL